MSHLVLTSDLVAAIAHAENPHATLRGSGPDAGLVYVATGEQARHVMALRALAGAYGAKAAGAVQFAIGDGDLALTLACAQLGLCDLGRELARIAYTAHKAANGRS